MKRKVEKYDFKALGQAIKDARNSKGMSRNQLADLALLFLYVHSLSVQ